MGRVLLPSSQMIHSDDMEKEQLNICFASLLFVVPERVNEAEEEES